MRSKNARIATVALACALTLGGCAERASFNELGNSSRPSSPEERAHWANIRGELLNFAEVEAYNYQSALDDHLANKLMVAHAEEVRNSEDYEFRTGDVPMPGTSFATFSASEQDEQQRASSCTLGFVAEHPESGRKYALTAAHCFWNQEETLWWKPNTTLTVGAEYSTSVGTVRTTGLQADPRRHDLAAISVPRTLQSRDFNDQGNINTDIDTDFAAIELSDEATDVATPDIRGHYRISKVLRAKDLYKDMPVCKMGARTGETCGHVLSFNNSMVRVTTLSKQGDSGGPLYTKLEDGTVAALGILSGSPSRGNIDLTGELDYDPAIDTQANAIPLTDASTSTVANFALLEPMLNELGLEIH